MPTPLSHQFQPSRCPRAYNLYENENGSDVTLMVGYEGCLERVPAHSWVLAAANPVLRAMFQGPLADRHKKTYNILNEPKAFQNLLRWLYCQECTLRSMDGALDTLHVAIEYLCPALAQQCADHIRQHLAAHNVLQVLHYIFHHCRLQPDNIKCSNKPTAPPLPDGQQLCSPPCATTVCQQREHPARSRYALHTEFDPAVPSAPSLEEQEDPASTNCGPAQTIISEEQPSQHTVHSMTQLQRLCEQDDLRDPTACCTDLFNECLELVDRQTEAILASEPLEELEPCVLELVVRRATLNVPNEEVVFEALLRWCTARCRRLKLSLTQDHRRQVLGGILYHVRFLTMAREQLQRTTGLLTVDELAYLAAALSAHSGGTAPASLTPHLSVMATPREHIPLTQVPTAKTKKKCIIRKGTLKKFAEDLFFGLLVAID